MLRVLKHSQSSYLEQSIVLGPNLKEKSVSKTDTNEQ